MSEEKKLDIKIKEVTAGFRGAFNYQSFNVSFTAEIGKDIDHKTVAEQLTSLSKEIVFKRLAELPKAEEKKEDTKEAAKKTFKPGEVQPKPFNCSECKAPITERANDYSFKNYKKALCFKCQGIEKAKEEEDKK